MILLIVQTTLQWVVNYEQHRFDIAAGEDNDKSMLLDTNCEELAIPSLSDCNETRTHNHLVCKRTLNYLAKLTSFDKELLDIQTITECRFTLNAYVAW